MLVKKLSISVLTGLFMVGSFVSPAFAGNESHSNHADMQYDKDSGSKSWKHDQNNNRWMWNWRNDEGDRNLSAALRGTKEVPGPGDEDGRGDAQIRLKPSKEEVCVELKVKNIDPATAAHIHKGTRHEAGPVVISLPTPDHNGYVEGCVTANKDLLKEIKKNPSDYYVNVHNNPFPNGAIRGQLAQ